MRNFLFKLKSDLTQLLAYPNVRLADDFRVDYDKYWKKRRKGSTAALSRWQKQRADLILKTIERGSTVMDIGSGDGALLKYLIDRGGVTGIAVDMSQPMLDQAKMLGIQTRLVDLRDELSLANLPEADYILGLEILEHMPEPEVLVMNLKGKARKGMIFSFPNTGYYAHRLRLLLGKFPLQWALYPGEHLRFWTVSDAKWWVRSLGFTFFQVRVYEGLPVLNRLLPSLFGQGIIVNLYVKEE